MPRFVSILACLGIFWAMQAGASTYRYEFDIIEFKIYFTDEYKFDSTGGDPATDERISWLPGERENYMRAYHPLGYMYGMTDRVVMDVSGTQTASGILEGSVTCVSAFCVLFRWDNFAHLPTESHGYLLLNNSLWYMGLKAGGEGHLEWHGNFRHEYHHFSCYSPEHPDCRILFWWPKAYFSIANFSRTELAPVPLPATAPALVTAVLILGAARMRRRARRS